MVFQDGHSYQNPKGDFRATVVMDNLIHEGAMPVTIGIFIDPGTKGPLPEKRGWQPAPSNRSFEYDTLSDQYARFLIDEILPEVGKKYKLTDDPEQRAIAGQSSGGISGLDDWPGKSPITSAKWSVTSAASSIFVADTTAKH